MIRPRLPSIKAAVMTMALWEKAAAGGSASGLGMFEDERRVRAAKAEGIGQDRPQAHIVASFPDNGYVRKGRIDIFDVGAFANEAVLHHQQRIDGLVHAGRPLRVAGQRLCGRNWRAPLARPEDLADGLDLF